MAQQVFQVNKPAQFRKAGQTDLIELLPVPGGNPIFVVKGLLETLTYGIVHHEFIHLSGPTGSAKSSLLEALNLAENFLPVCAALRFPERPLKMYTVEMATYETPGELYQRRALRDGTTYDETSKVVEALQHAPAVKGTAYPIIWLREMGRVHSSSVQGGLLNLLTKGDIILPDGTRTPGHGISWVADSNYQAERDSTHTLVTLDDALKRRFSINLTLDYLPGEQEIVVLRHLLRERTTRKIDPKLTAQVVSLGQIIRHMRADGGLQSVTPPSIYGYLSFLTMAQAMPHLTVQQIAMATLLGNASQEDKKLIPGLFNEVFGVHLVDEDDLDLAHNLF